MSIGQIYRDSVRETAAKIDVYEIGKEKFRRTQTTSISTGYRTMHPRIEKCETNRRKKILVLDVRSLFAMFLSFVQLAGGV